MANRSVLFNLNTNIYMCLDGYFNSTVLVKVNDEILEMFLLLLCMQS